MRPLGINLYRDSAGHPSLILTAVDALMPYDVQHPWPHQQIVKGREGSLCPALFRSWAFTHEEKYLDAQKRFACSETPEAVIESSVPDLASK
jgi:hypothetical protein